MDYFAPGLRELSRMLGRQWLGLRLLVARRRLARAEATLGLLGWQQADFDDGTEGQVGRIVEYEREQARATNESAAAGRALRELTEAREVGRKHCAQERSALETARREILQRQSSAEEQLAERQRLEPDFDRRMPELDREMRESSRRYSELLSSGSAHNAAIKQELMRLRERAVALPNEKADLRMSHLRIATDIRALEAQLERERTALADIDQRERALTDAFKAADHDLAGQIKELEKQRADFEQEFESLEGAKANPYREVGRVLADSGIAPVNQPQALAEVQRRRLIVEEHEHRRALSLGATAGENPTEIRQSLRIWAGIAVATVAFIIALIALG